MKGVQRKKRLCKYCGCVTYNCCACTDCRGKLPVVKKLVQMCQDFKHEVAKAKSRRRVLELYNEQRWKEQ